MVVFVVLLTILSMSISGCTQPVSTPTATPAAGEDSKFQTVTDMRGVQVKVPKDIKRVATIDDGFVEGVMTNLGVIDKVAAIGTLSLKKDFKYDYTTASGVNYSYAHGWNTMRYLHPWLNDIPCLTQDGEILNLEVLANVSPDVVILRVGDCMVGSDDREAMNKTINTIESLGFPLIVLYAPSYYSNSDLSTMKEESRIIGKLFNKESQAVEFADYLQGTEKLIRDRTKDVPESQKPDVLYIGLSSKARQSGGSGSVWGTDTLESYLIENVTNAKNAYTGTGSGKILNAEQILALDPDVILLPTLAGYHPARELYEAPYYQNLQELKAVKNKRVYSMPWTPWNCARRAEYPIDMMIIAKASYPDKFGDIKIHDFAIDFYKHAYGVNETTAKGLLSNQWLDWTVEQDF